jgi:hypothetical protein
MGSVGLTERAGGGSRSSTVAYAMSVLEAGTAEHWPIPRGICSPIGLGIRCCLCRWLPCLLERGWSLRNLGNVADLQIPALGTSQRRIDEVVKRNQVPRLRELVHIRAVIRASRVPGRDLTRLVLRMPSFNHTQPTDSSILDAGAAMQVTMRACIPQRSTKSCAQLLWASKSTVESCCCSMGRVTGT